jgi:hypothetical protein
MKQAPAFNLYSDIKSGCVPYVEQPKETMGFVRDGVPWLWSEAAQDWRPVTETKYAARYAALQAERG